MNSSTILFWSQVKMIEKPLQKLWLENNLFISDFIVHPSKWSPNQIIHAHCIYSRRSQHKKTTSPNLIRNQCLSLMMNSISLVGTSLILNLTNGELILNLPSLESRKLTAFTATMGLIKFNFMLFGVSTACASYILLIKIVLRRLQNVSRYHTLIIFTDVLGHVMNI